MCDGDTIMCHNVENGVPDNPEQVSPCHVIWNCCPVDPEPSEHPLHDIFSGVSPNAKPNRRIPNQRRHRSRDHRGKRRLVTRAKLRTKMRVKKRVVRGRRFARAQDNPRPTTRIATVIVAVPGKAQLEQWNTHEQRGSKKRRTIST
jgi:hypothetical protein